MNALLKTEIAPALGCTGPITVNGQPLSKWLPIDGCSLFFEPFKKCVSGDLLLLAFILFRSGPLAPIVKLLVGDPSGLDPRKAPLVLSAVCLEYRIIGLLQRPLLKRANLPALLLSSRYGPVTIFSADTSRLGEVASAVLTPPHCDVPFHTTPQ